MRAPTHVQQQTFLCVVAGSHEMMTVGEDVITGLAHHVTEAAGCDGFPGAMYARQTRQKLRMSILSFRRENEVKGATYLQ